MMHPRAYVWAACAGMIGLSVCCAAAAEEPADNKLLQLNQADIAAYNSVMDMRMHVSELLDNRVSADITNTDAKNRVVRLDKWHGAPSSVTANVALGEIHIRNESDFVIVWIRRDAAVPREGTPLEIINHATEGMLAEAYLAGPADKVIAAGARAPEGKEIRILKAAATVAGAITCSYGSVSRHWPFVDSIHVLVKDRDVIVVCEKSKARQSFGSGQPVVPYVYEGLTAAKVRVTEADAKKLADQPVLARNSVFNQGDDLGKLSDAILNGCLWPLADQTSTDICSADLLRKAEKPAGTAGESSSQKQMKESTK